MKSPDDEIQLGEGDVEFVEDRDPLRPDEPLDPSSFLSVALRMNPTFETMIRKPWNVCEITFLQNNIAVYEESIKNFAASNGFLFGIMGNTITLTRTNRAEIGGLATFLYRFFLEGTNINVRFKPTGDVFPPPESSK